MDKFSILGKLTAIEGKRDELRAILLTAAIEMELIPDCELYVVNISEDSNSVYVYEVWSTENAHKASLDLEVTKNLIKQAMPILSGVERLHTFKALGGKGLSNPN